MTTDSFYSSLADDYDRVIRWERRLAAERPWFLNLWRLRGARSVLDASCGTGRHIPMFHGMGLDVWGADASPEMIAAARRNAADAGLVAAGFDPETRLVCAPWASLPGAVPRTFDAVLCIGNSLPYVLDPDTMHASLRGLWSRVAPGGILVVQVRNFEKLYMLRERFLPLNVGHSPRETVALRMYDYEPDRILFHVIMLEKHDGEWTMRHRETPLRPWGRHDLEAPLRALGASTAAHGNLGLAPFDPLTSEDLVVVATRPGSGEPGEPGP